MCKKLILLSTFIMGMAVLPCVNAQKIPIENFVRPDEFSEPKLSPDGQYLAITRRQSINGRDVPVINVFSLPGMKQEAAVRMPSYEIPISYLWATNKRILVTVGKEIGSREAPIATGEILAMDFNGENQEYLYGYQMKERSKYVDRYEDNNGHGTINSLPKELDGSFFLTASMWESESTMLYRVNSKNAVTVQPPHLALAVQIH